MEGTVNIYHAHRATRSGAVDADAQAFASPEERRVRDVMSACSPRTVEALAKASGLSPREVSGALGALDLAGAVEERERGWVLVPGTGVR